jgi:hypothetical protein
MKAYSTCKHVLTWVMVPIRGEEPVWRLQLLIRVCGGTVVAVAQGLDEHSMDIRGARSVGCYRVH